MTRLRTILDEATALLARNNADVGARVQRRRSTWARCWASFEERATWSSRCGRRDRRYRAARRRSSRASRRSSTPGRAGDDGGPRNTVEAGAERMANGMREDSQRFYHQLVQDVSRRTRGRRRPTSRSAAPTRSRASTPSGGRLPACSTPSPNRPRCPRRCGGLADPRRPEVLHRRPRPPAGPPAPLPPLPPGQQRPRPPPRPAKLVEDSAPARADAGARGRRAGSRPGL